MKNLLLSLLAALAALLLALPASGAKLEIEIVQGNASQLPIAIVPFQWRASGYPPVEGVHTVVADDLYRSGLFDPMEEGDMVELPSEAEAIRFGTWRLLLVDYIVIGHVNDSPGRRLRHRL